MNVLKSKDIQEYIEKFKPYKCVKINTLNVDVEMLNNAHKIMAQIIKNTVISIYLLLSEFIRRLSIEKLNAPMKKLIYKLPMITHNKS